jgi:hypothetical protein
MLYRTYRPAAESPNNKFRSLRSCHVSFVGWPEWLPSWAQMRQLHVAYRYARAWAQPDADNLGRLRNSMYLSRRVG